MKKFNLLNSAFLALKGAVIGIGAIMPGISGGVLCLVLGIYRPMMELIANPFKEIKKRFWFFLPVVIGLGVGILGISKVVELLFRSSPVSSTWLFAGLIMGTLPGLWKEAGSDGRKKSDWITGVVSFIVVFSILLTFTLAGSAHVTPNIGIWILCGVLWAIGFTVPGMSPSAIFLFMGIYETMSAGIASLDMSVLLPMGAGMILALFPLTRGISVLFDKAKSIAMHICFGAALASALVVLPFGESSSSFMSILGYIACFAGGLVIALLMDKMSSKIPDTGDE